MLPKELTGDLSKRLATIKGQIDGLIKMIDDDKDPDQILNQFKAADQGLQKAHHLLLDEVFRKSLALKLVQVINACPGNCQDADKIEFMKDQFPVLEFDHLTTNLKEINAIDKRLEKHNKNNFNKDLGNPPLSADLCYSLLNKKYGKSNKKKNRSLYRRLYCLFTGGRYGQINGLFRL